LIIKFPIGVSMNRLIFVGLGGFIGAILRYLISGFAQDLSNSISFPYGTLAVNVIGCFSLGFLTQLFENHVIVSPELRLLLLVGVLGSFTTFSTFSNETLNLIQEQKLFLALVNISVQLILGLSAGFLGRLTSISLWR